MLCAQYQLQHGVIIIGTALFLDENLDFPDVLQWPYFRFWWAKIGDLLFIRNEIDYSWINYNFKPVKIMGSAISPFKILSCLAWASRTVCRKTFCTLIRREGEYFPTSYSLPHVLVFKFQPLHMRQFLETFWTKKFIHKSHTPEHNINLPQRWPDNCILGCEAFLPINLILL